MLLLGMKTIIIKIRNSIVRLIVKLELKREAMNQKIKLSTHMQQRESKVDIKKRSKDLEGRESCLIGQAKEIIKSMRRCKRIARIVERHKSSDS